MEILWNRKEVDLLSPVSSESLFPICLMSSNPWGPQAPKVSTATGTNVSWLFRFLYFDSFIDSADRAAAPARAAVEVKCDIAVVSTQVKSQTNVLPAVQGINVI